jgi:hypothetical protein
VPLDQLAILANTLDARTHFHGKPHSLQANTRESYIVARGEKGTSGDCDRFAFFAAASDASCVD